MSEQKIQDVTTEAIKLDDLKLDDVEIAVEEDAYALPEAGASVSPKYSCSSVWPK